MILRSLTKHLQDQNWLAIILDFVIVVIGVGVALVAQNWLVSANERAELAKAEYILTDEILFNYYNALEHLSGAECRKKKTLNLIQQLLDSGEKWEGAMQEERSELGTVFQTVLSTSRRPWGSAFWNAELQRGALNQMDNQRRYDLGSVFVFSKIAGEFDAKSQAYEAQLNVLSLAMTFTAADRSHYLAILASHDGVNAAADVVSSQLKERIENLDIDRNHPSWSVVRDLIISSNKEGGCFTPIVSEFLDVAAQN